MMHKNRRHKVCAVDTFALLVDKLTQHTWTTCSAFSCGSLTLLNDSTCGDGAQEYSVIRNGRQVESLTVSWMTPEKLLDLLLAIEAGTAGLNLGPLEALPHCEGYCPRCA